LVDIRAVVGGDISGTRAVDKGVVGGSLTENGEKLRNQIVKISTDSDVLASTEGLETLSLTSEVGDRILV
jgi:hypothetical protein